MKRWAFCAAAAVAGVFGFLLSGQVRAQKAPQVVTFEGACDASGAVVLDGARFFVGDDEDNVLRIYDADSGGEPKSTHDVSVGLGLPKGKKRFPEADIEAGTGLGDRALWLTSHGRDSKGRRADSRILFFATKVNDDGVPEVVGEPYRRLLEDLVALPSLRRFRLAQAAQVAPKAPGGLNIEGMTAMEDGKSVLIGFRSPVPDGKALVIALHNPLEVLAGKKPRFGEPVLLDLEGRGVRSISYWRGRYLLVGGPAGAGGEGSALYSWRPEEGATARREDVDLTDFNPEGFVTFEDRDQFLVLSDDGARADAQGIACKKQKDPSKKSFRGVWITLPHAARAKAAPAQRPGL